jgi:predicted TIM-barrel fold metal-dependent hydrolase
MRSLLITLFLFVLVLLEGCSGEGRKNAADKFYSMEDFAKVKKTDMHYHFNTTDSAIFSLAARDNFRLIGIVDDRPLGLPMKDQQEIAFRLNDLFPEKFSFASTFAVYGWDEDGWIDSTLTHLKYCISKGAVAVKVWKNIGMDLRDKDGKFVMVDNPQLDPVFDFLAKSGITLIGHNGEPKDCWLPLEEMIVRGNKNYYSEHPEYHMFLHPDFPSYQDQIDARDHMLAKHPDLKFVGCHLGSLEWSLDELGQRLDKFPNMAVDLSRMANLHIHAMNDRQKARDFFIKYQDRLVYGTDRSVNRTKDVQGFLKNVHDSWLRDWKFLVTDEMIESTDVEGKYQGLKLPSAVIDKIYSKNAESWNLK